MGFLRVGSLPGARCAPPDGAVGVGERFVRTLRLIRDMKPFILLASLLTASVLAFPTDHSDGPHLSVKSMLTLEGAKQAGHAAEAFAKQNGATPSIAVVDDSGTLLYFVRLDGNFAAAANVSIGKARTSALFKKPTKDFEDAIQQGRIAMTALPDFTPLRGGVPILHGNQVIGAVGVSGAKSALQDEEVAQAGAAAFGTESTAK